jgi:hypothetical protein
MSVNCTKHANIRMQQRGISAVVLQYLQEVGEISHDGHGARLLTFSKKSKSRLRKMLEQKEYARIESKLNVYAVVSEHGSIITVGYKQHRFYL